MTGGRVSGVGAAPASLAAAVLARRLQCDLPTDCASSLVSLRHEGRRSALPVLLSLRAPTELALNNDVCA